MAARVDPRAWNLLASLSLAAGACSGRTVGDDGIADDDSSSTGDGDGVYGDGDYGDGHHDEWSEYECYTAALR